jgi:signal transduction histidine kinase
LNPAPLDPGELVAAAQATLLPLAIEKGLNLTWSATDDVPEFVELDGPRVQQILQNLMGNALKVCNQEYSLSYLLT